MHDLPRPLLVSTTALILTNAISLALAAAGIWDLGELLALQWAETLATFVLIKIWVDLCAHLAEHREGKAAADGSGAAV
jgi:hypothetical protein